MSPSSDLGRQAHLRALQRHSEAERHWMALTIQLVRGGGAAGQSACLQDTDTHESREVQDDSACVQIHKPAARQGHTLFAALRLLEAITGALRVQLGTELDVQRSAAEDAAEPSTARSMAAWQQGWLS